MLTSTRTLRDARANQLRVPPPLRFCRCPPAFRVWPFWPRRGAVVSLPASSYGERGGRTAERHETAPPDTAGDTRRAVGERRTSDTTLAHERKQDAHLPYVLPNLAPFLLDRAARRSACLIDDLIRCH